MCRKNDFQRDEDEPSHGSSGVARRNESCRLFTISWPSCGVLTMRLTANIHTL